MIPPRQGWRRVPCRHPRRSTSPLCTERPGSVDALGNVEAASLRAWGICCNPASRGVLVAGNQRVMRTITGLMLLALLLGGCGGGGGDNTPPAPPKWQSGVFQTSTNFQALCPAPRSGTDPATGMAYPDKPGTLLDENSFLRSWTNELYLWFDEVVDQDPSLFSSTASYFNVLRTTATTPSGAAKDKFHFTYSSADWYALSQGRRAGRLRSAVGDRVGRTAARRSWWHTRMRVRRPWERASRAARRSCPWMASTSSTTTPMPASTRSTPDCSRLRRTKPTCSRSWTSARAQAAACRWSRRP